MFYQHYLGNNKPTFLACNPEQVYAAILEFSKNKGGRKPRNMLVQHFGQHVGAVCYTRFFKRIKWTALSLVHSFACCLSNKDVGM